MDESSREASSAKGGSLVMNSAGASSSGAGAPLGVLRRPRSPELGVLRATFGEEPSRDSGNDDWLPILAHAAPSPPARLSSLLSSFFSFTPARVRVHVQRVRSICQDED
jgi:hypothetical protein